MDRFLSSLWIDLCKSTSLIFITLAAIGSVRAEEALPSQEQALARALENHPDIVAAKAKVALADAELYGKRMEVSRQILGLYGSLKMLDAQIEASKAALNRSQQAAGKGGTVDQSAKDKLAAEVQTAEAQLVQSMSQREQAEKELRLLIGTASPGAEAKSSSKAATAARQTPQGPIIEAMNRAQEKRVQLEFLDMPLREVMEVFSDRAGVKFSLQLPALDSAGLNDTIPISLHTNEVPLYAALQAFEDANPGLQFVLRDYGVLLTTRENAQKNGYVRVLELGREPATSSKSR